MNKYEAMCIIKPDLGEEERKAIFSQINDTVSKNSGNITNSVVWSERRKLIFSIRKYNEGVYYLLDFTLEDSQKMPQIRQAYKLNENILRVLITRRG